MSDRIGSNGHLKVGVSPREVARAAGVLMAAAQASPDAARLARVALRFYRRYREHLRRRQAPVRSGGAVSRVSSERYLG